MKYKFEEINIGDEVIFKSTTSQTNHNLYWKVIAKIEMAKQLIIQLDNMGHKDLLLTLNIKDVLYHTPMPK